MKSKSLILVVFAIVLIAVDVQAQFGGRRRQGTSYSWDIDIDGAGTLVTQEAYVMSTNNINVTFVKSFDEDMKENNLTGATVLYDSSQVVAIKFKSRSSPCFLTSTVISYSDMVALIGQINGTAIPLSWSVVNLNATSKPLSFRAAIRKYIATPSLFTLCWGGRLVETTAATGDGSDDDTVVVKSTLSLEGRVNLIFPKQSGRPKPPGPRPRPGGGRPGGGRPGAGRPGGGRPGAGRPGAGRPRNRG